jgi:hypothetical protein
MTKKNNAKLPKLAPLDVPEDPGLVDMLEDDTEPEVVPVKSDAPAKVEPEVVAEPVRPDVREFYQRFKELGEKILVNYDSDRDQIEKVVAHLMQIVVHNQDGKLSKTATENLVKALEVKSNTNANAIKILDYISKAITAGKGMGVFDGTKDDDLDFDMRDMEDLLGAEEGTVKGPEQSPEEAKDTDE